MALLVEMIVNEDTLSVKCLDQWQPCCLDGVVNFRPEFTLARQL